MANGLAPRLRELHAMTDDNDPLIMAAWWESLGLGRTQKKRQAGQENEANGANVRCCMPWIRPASGCAVA